MEKKIKINHRFGPYAIRKMLLQFVGQGKSLSQPYHSILMSEMNCINGEDVGTLLGLGCH